MDSAAIADLARSGITPDQAAELGIYQVDDAKEDCFPEFKSGPALVFPYFDPWTDELLTFDREGKMTEFARVRYLRKPIPGRKMRRYDQPRGSGVMPYFPRCIEWQTVFSDNGQAIIITEGEKKAAALALQGIPAIGLGGVYNFLEGGRFLDLLERVPYARRCVVIVFDSDRASNPDVRVAEDRLAKLIVERGGEVVTVQLPPGQDDAKVGLDDYLVAEGLEPLLTLMHEKAIPLRKIDAAVNALNGEVAYIEADDMVYDMTSRGFLKKGAFVNGSRFSALKIKQAAVQGNGIKEYSVAEEWLKHEGARRYRRIMFDPSTDETGVELPDGGTALNIWHGFRPKQGDVTPFLELNDFLFSQLPEEDRDYALKLMAYKAQNPAEKVGQAIVLIGPQGCGKSMWAKIMRLAFAPYGEPVSSGALMLDFNGWVERSLLVTIDEAQAVHVHKAGDKLKNIITEDTMFVNEKFRPAAPAANLCTVIMTSNDRRVGSYSHDDRRMFVVDCPDKRELGFYLKIVKWMKDDGPAKVMNYLLNYDLKGWIPPDAPPLTTEKVMARSENVTPAERLAHDIKTANEHVIVMWIAQALAWAQSAMESSNQHEARLGREIHNSLSLMQIRPYYTPEELALIFPMITTQLYAFKGGAIPSGQISRELRNAGVSYLKCSDSPNGFLVNGQYKQFLVVSEADDWGKVPLSQSEFDRLRKEWPTYAAARGLQDKKKHRSVA